MQMYKKNDSAKTEKAALKKISKSMTKNYFSWVWTCLNMIRILIFILLSSHLGNLFKSMNLICAVEVLFLV